MEEQQQNSEIQAPQADYVEEMSPETARQYSMLTWIFAPITSFVWKNSSNPLLAGHAQQSLYLGVANILMILAILTLQVLYNIVFASLLGPILWGLGSLINCGWQFIWVVNSALIILPRLLGIYKASLNEQWTVPYVSKIMSKFIKI